MSVGSTELSRSGGAGVAGGGELNAVHVVVPEGIDDPARPSGGNTFGRRLCRGLPALGWRVHVHKTPSDEVLAETLSRVPDGGLVLLDGLVASPAPGVLLPESGRLRLVVLLHMPLGDERERAVLSAARAVVTTSAWSRRAVLRLYSLRPGVVHVAEPGVDPAALAAGTPTGASLLSVAAVIPGKGHDVLIDALGMLRGPSWHCVCVGSLEREPEFAATLRRQVAERGLEGRVLFSGAQTGAALSRSYRAADVLVLPSRGETYGMVVTEALARGLPVIATDIGGVPEALGHGADGTRPGLLVPPEDTPALRDALRAWLEDHDLRRRLRRAARERRASLSRWSATTAAVAEVLAGAAR